MLIGLFMLDVIRIPFQGLSKLTARIGEKSTGSYWSSLFWGMIFALAFCPYSGVLYFVMLIPLTISSANGLYLPILYAIATALPVIVFAWLLAFAVGSVASLYKHIKTFELWFRRIVAVLFIGVGAYYVYLLFL